MNSVTDTKVYVASDRYHVWSKLTLKLHELFKVRNKPKPKLDIYKLK